MQTYRAEETAELLFNFPDGLSWSELDKQGVKLPVRMKFVDLVIERDKDILLVEIKDPSHSRSQDKERNSYLKRLTDNSVLTQELTWFGGICTGYSERAPGPFQGPIAGRHSRGIFRSMEAQTYR